MLCKTAPVGVLSSQRIMPCGDVADDATVETSKTRSATNIVMRPQSHKSENLLVSWQCRDTVLFGGAQPRP